MVKMKLGFLLLLGWPLLGQVESTGANLPAQPIGAADLLAVSVYGAPELTRTVRVGEDGLVRLPMLREAIDARGLLPAELEKRIAQALVDEGLLVDPSVAVTIAEYHSRPVSVAGAVKSPLTFQAVGKMTLLEAITRAQGLSEDAGSEILVTRPPRNGEPGLTQRISKSKLLDAGDPAANSVLEGGEEVRVPRSGRIFVVGNVKKPGSFFVEAEGQTTVLKAVAMAEGLAPYANKIAYVFRPEDGARKEILVELRKILDRKAEDMTLAANDVLYVPLPVAKGAVPEQYFHFDSWRVNTGAGQWVPAQIYVEEEGGTAANFAPRFKAQSRIWDYAASPGRKFDELTSILVEGAAAPADQDTPNDLSPLESQRFWERQAEENVLARLEKGGMLAASGAVDQVLETVVTNLAVSAKLSVDVRCRVLLTTPMETFVVGHTIVISRGLIDVLPDEASLALVLAGELAHIALGHPTQTQFAFHNQTMLSDQELLQRFRFRRTPDEALAASKKTIEIMRASPYQNTASMGLFLKALEAHRAALPRLLQANLGDQVADPSALRQLAEFAAAAPALAEAKLEQIAALPLGSRVKMDPWTNRIELVKTRPLALLSAREKMPFEVTPFALYLTRAPAATK